MVQRRAARRIFHDFSHSTSASALVTRLELQRLETRKRVGKVSMMSETMQILIRAARRLFHNLSHSTVDKVSMMSKVMNYMVDIAPTPGILSAKQQNRKRSAAETSTSAIFQDKYTPQLFRPFCDPTVDLLSPEAQTVASLDAFKRKLEGHAVSARPHEHLFWPVFNILIPSDQL